MSGLKFYLTGYVKLQVVISLTPMHPTYQITWCIKPKYYNLKLSKFSNLLRSTEVKGWCGKVCNLFTNCYVAVMLYFHTVDDTI